MRRIPNKSQGRTRSSQTMKAPLAKSQPLRSTISCSRLARMAFSRQRKVIARTLTILKRPPIRLGRSLGEFITRSELEGCLFQSWPPCKNPVERHGAHETRHSISLSNKLILAPQRPTSAAQTSYLGFTHNNGFFNDAAQMSHPSTFLCSLDQVNLI